MRGLLESRRFWAAAIAVVVVAVNHFAGEAIIDADAEAKLVALVTAWIVSDGWRSSEPKPK